MFARKSSGAMSARFLLNVNGDSLTCLTPQFDPVQGTVVFGSALWGYAFTLETFAALYAAKTHDSRSKEGTPKRTPQEVKPIEILIALDCIAFAH